MNAQANDTLSEAELDALLQDDRRVTRSCYALLAASAVGLLTAHPVGIGLGAVLLGLAWLCGFPLARVRGYPVLFGFFGIFVALGLPNKHVVRFDIEQALAKKAKGESLGPPGGRPKGF